MSIFCLFPLQTLGWCLCPVTALSWLTFYFQVTSTKESSDVLEPQFPRDIFLQMTRVGLHLTWKLTQWPKKLINAALMTLNLLFQLWPCSYFCFLSQLLDLCVLHMRSMDFQKNVLAASVLCYFVQQETVEKVSGEIFFFIFLLPDVLYSVKLQLAVCQSDFLVTEPRRGFQGCPVTPSRRVWTGWRPLQRWQVCLPCRSAGSSLRWTLKTSTTSRPTRITWPCWSVSFLFACCFSRVASVRPAAFWPKFSLIFRSVPADRMFWAAFPLWLAALRSKTHPESSRFGHSKRWRIEKKYSSLDAEAHLSSNLTGFLF